MTWTSNAYACLPALLAVAIACSVAVTPVTAQQSDPAKPSASRTPLERLGPNLLRAGSVTIDTAKREVTAQGTFTGVSALEFIAVAKGGFKAYESAVELDATAIDFNLGLILIGLDPARASVPKFHFDPDLPKGDPVEIWLEWNEGGKAMRVRAEQLVYNEITKQVLPEGPWVYTGSTFSSHNNAYLAEIEGTLIGFVHTPAPLIESPRPLVEGAYGNNLMNPAFAVEMGTPVTLTVRALPLAK